MHSQRNINESRRQLSEWEKIFANKAADKGLILKICKQLIEINVKKTHNSIEKWVEDLDRFFSKEDTDGKETHEKKSASQRCNEVSPHPTHNGHDQSSYKQQMLEKFWRKGKVFHHWWECKLIQILWIIVWKVLNKTKNRTTI